MPTPKLRTISTPAGRVVLPVLGERIPPAELVKLRPFEHRVVLVREKPNSNRRTRS